MSSRTWTRTDLFKLFSAIISNFRDITKPSSSIIIIYVRYIYSIYMLPIVPGTKRRLVAAVLLSAVPAAVTRVTRLHAANEK